MFQRTLGLLLCGLCIASCESQLSAQDAGSPNEVGADAGAATDAGAANGVDGGAIEIDGGVSADGGLPGDAGSGTDAGMDAGWLGPDGGVWSGMSFFVTSTGMGKGGDLRADAGDADGLAGADAFCRKLAASVDPSLGNRTWRAYLSTAAVNARDRVGNGPWVNAKGVLIAQNLAQLHDEGGATNAMSYANSLDEMGNLVPGVVRPTGTTNVHDVLTGSNAQGMVENNAHCANWTSSAPNQTARVGHHDRTGGGQVPNSWNSAHLTQGCAESGGQSVGSGGGRGSFYCFAAD